MAIFDLFSGKVPPVKSYKEAYDLSLELVKHSPRKAIKVIKSISKQNLPVEEPDLPLVKSMASLVLKPNFNQASTGKKLLEKVVAMKEDDFMANSVLFYLSISKNDVGEAQKYAKNLLKADYKARIKQVQANAKANQRDFNQSLGKITELYQAINALFLDEGDEELAAKAMEIAREISPEKEQNKE